MRKWRNLKKYTWRKRMPSLDGYSLNEEIKKLRDEVYNELIQMRESFREIYHYLDNIEKKQAAVKAAPKKKEVKDAKSKEVRSKVSKRESSL